MTNQPQLITDFMEWRNGLQKEIRGGVLMFDVHGHYKWLNEKELFDYYIQVSTDKKHNRNGNPPTPTNPSPC